MACNDNKQQQLNSSHWRNTRLSSHALIRPWWLTPDQGEAALVSQGCGHHLAHLPLRPGGSGYRADGGPCSQEWPVTVQQEWDSSQSAEDAADLCPREGLTRPVSSDALLMLKVESKNSAMSTRYCFPPVEKEGCACPDSCVNRVASHFVSPVYPSPCPLALCKGEHERPQELSVLPGFSTNGEFHTQNFLENHSNDVGNLIIVFKILQQLCIPMSVFY